MQPIHTTDGGFRHALESIYALLPLLGATRKEQAGMLSVLAGIVEGRITLEHLGEVREERQSPPPPAPALPHYPEPASFQPEMVIGHVAGAPVIGLAYWNEEDGQIRRYDVRAELDGLKLVTDGETLTIDAPDLGEPGICDRWRVVYIGQLVEAAQAGHLAELLPLARRWCGAAELQARSCAA